MPPRKKQSRMSEPPPSQNLAELPKSDYESVDDILANVDQFIESVYSDLRITPPRSSLGGRHRRSLNLPSASQSSTSSILESSSPEAGAVGGGILTTVNEINSADSSLTVDSPLPSPSRRYRSYRNMDAEVERINRICNNVDQNLRSIGLLQNDSRNESITSSSSSSSSSSVENTSNTTNSDFIELSPTSSATATSISSLTLNSPPVTTTAQQNSRRSFEQVVSSQIIDLSDTQTQTPEVLRQPQVYSYHVDEDDDDVIIVSANTPPVVDLCTPGGAYTISANRRPIVDHSQLSRRRLNQGFVCPSTADTSKRRAEVAPYKSPVKKPETNSTIADNISNHIPSTAANTDRTPFMCAVCMESSIQRQPTSTKCGHVFCQECIRQAIRLTHKCPLCNTKITNNQIFRIYI